MPPSHSLRDLNCAVHNSSEIGNYARLYARRQVCTRLAFRSFKQEIFPIGIYGNDGSGTEWLRTTTRNMAYSLHSTSHRKDGQFKGRRSEVCYAHCPRRRALQVRIKKRSTGVCLSRNLTWCTEFKSKLDINLIISLALISGTLS